MLAYDKTVADLVLIHETYGFASYRYRSNAPSNLYGPWHVLFIMTHADNQFELEMVQAAFSEFLKKTGKKGEFFIDIMSGQNSLFATYDAINSHFMPSHHLYDAVVTTGTMPAVAFDTLAKIRGLPTPHLFANIIDIHRLERYSMSESLDKPLATGIKRVQKSFLPLIDFLGIATPKEKKRALLAYDFATSPKYLPGSVPSIDVIHPQLHNHQFKVSDVGVRTYEDIGTIVSKHGKDFGYVIVPPQCDILNAHIKELSYNCKKNGVALVSSNATNMGLGSSFGIGDTGLEHGKKLGEMLYRVLHEKTHPSEIRAITREESQTIFYHKDNPFELDLRAPEISQQFTLHLF